MKTLNKASGKESDLGTLIELTRLQVLEAEGKISSTNSEIKDGLMDQLQNGISAFFLKWDAEIVGFALINTAQKPYSLKSFYVTRNYRRSGVKELNFKKLAEMLEIDLLEAEGNPGNNSSHLRMETLASQKRMVLSQAVRE